MVWDVREDSRLLHYYKKKEGQKTLEVCINAGEEPVRTGGAGLPEPETACQRTDWSTEA